jgi:hypothetical protein
MMEPVTEREVLIRLDSNVGQLKESIDRLSNTFKNFEETKIKDIDVRLTKIENWKSEFSGAYKVGIIIALVLGIISTIKTFL